MNQPASITPARRKIVEAFLDSLSDPFRRSALSTLLYQTTSPRSRAMADKLADAAMRDLAAAGRIQRHGHLHWVKVQIERTLRSGRRVPEHSDAVALSITTRCPRKWLIIDLETGNTMVGDAKGWRLARESEKSEAAVCLTRR